MPDLSKYKRILLLTEGRLGVFTSKTAVALLRFRPEDVLGVVDSTCAGQSLPQLLPGLPDRPIFANVEQTLPERPDALFVGIHPAGGALPEVFRQQVAAALRAGIDVVNGLHQLLANDPELCRLAEAGGARIIELRLPPAERTVAGARARDTRARRVLTIGTDCNVGKMATAAALTNAARLRGLDARLIATGQTGIMLAGKGAAVDATISDFAAGAVEELVLAEADSDICFIEGQAGLGHPGFSGVALSIVHGCCPDAMILVHNAGRSNHRTAPHGPLPPLGKVWRAYEMVADLVHPTRIVGVALNPCGADESVVAYEKNAIEREFHVPVVDPLGEGCDPLLEAILKAAPIRMPRSAAS